MRSPRALAAWALGTIAFAGLAYAVLSDPFAPRITAPAATESGDRNGERVADHEAIPPSDASAQADTSSEGALAKGALPPGDDLDYVDYEEDDGESDRLASLTDAIVLDQARENPHQTPDALIDFAHRLAVPMERAMKSERDALPVFAQMETCASNGGESLPIQARIVCLANAGRLAEQYPQMSSRYQALARRNPDIASILETTGL